MNLRRTFFVGLWISLSVFWLWVGITDLNRGRMGFGIVELIIAGYLTADNIDSIIREWK